MTTGGAMTREAAERVALDVLDWLAANPEALGRVLAGAGAGPDDLRAAARRPEFLGFVLDALLADEAMLLDCAGAIGMAPDLPARARAALPGGDAPHWT